MASDESHSSPRTARSTWAAWVDTGGTFTDFVRVSREGVTVHKVPSTPDDPGRAVVDGLREMSASEEADRLVHGTTVATNALLTRSGGPVALVTTVACEVGDDG